MKTIGLRMGIISVAIGLVTLVGSATLANGQNREYRDWQRAQARAQRDCMNYQRKGHSGDYNRCQNSQAEANRLQMIYQQRAGYTAPVYRNYGYTVPTARYRVYGNGGMFYVDERGADLLRAGINRGYQEGYQQGVMDRRYGRGYNYYGNQVYLNGMFGYESYVPQNQYQYYFQQGFQRGYEDGYNNTFRYGYRNGNTFSILGSVIGSILDLATDQ